MKLKELVFIYLLIFSTFLACTVPYDIVIDNEQNSAIITTETVLENEISEFCKSEIITIIDTSYFNLIYKIENIDSIGNYLPELEKGFYQFELINNILTITDGNTNSVYKKEYGGKPSIQIEIVFESDIEILKCINEKVEVVNNNTIKFYRPKQHMLNPKKRMELVIKIN